MKHLVRSLFAFSLALILVAGVSADEKEKKKEDKKPPVNPYTGLFQFPKTITLTSEQNKKIEELRKEFTPKLDEMKKKHDVIMTADREKLYLETVKKARAEGKKGKEVEEAVAAALKLTKEEQHDLKELNSHRGRIFGEVIKRKMAVLTEEQRAALRSPPKKDKDKKPEPKDK